jgi:hypothetical protein
VCTGLAEDKRLRSRRSYFVVPVGAAAALEGADSVFAGALSLDSDFEGLLDVSFVSLDSLLSLEPLDSPPSSFFVGFAEEYESAYQPPPFRMKLPPLICRFAVAFEHFGQI